MHRSIKALRSWLWRVLATALVLGTSGCATSAPCDPRYTASPQAAADCRFRNMPNPAALPAQSSWKIWTRFAG
mgnify:FL=1